MTNLLGSIRLAAYAFPLIAALVAVPFFDRQVRVCCFNWVRTVFGGLFLFYVLCVLALVFFPLPDAAQAARLSGHEIQLVPFQFVADFLRETPLVLSDARTYLPALFDRTVLQVVCNILMLLPFGMYLRYVCGLDLGKVALVSLAFSAFIELGQLTGLFFMFRGSYRLCDVDDLMLNTIGGLLGGELVHALEAYLPPLDAFDRFPGSSALAMQRLDKHIPTRTQRSGSRWRKTAWRRPCRFFAAGALCLLRVAVDLVAAAEEQGNAPDRGQTHERVDHAGDHGGLPAADPRHEIEPEQTDAAPVEPADDRKDQRDAVDHLHMLPSPLLCTPGQYAPAREKRFRRRQNKCPTDTVRSLHFARPALQYHYSLSN